MSSIFRGRASIPESSSHPALRLSRLQLRKRWNSSDQSTRLDRSFKEFIPLFYNSGIFLHTAFDSIAVFLLLFLKVNFQNIYIDNLFDLCYNNIQVVRLFFVYLYLFISAKNDCFYRFKAEFDVPTTYPLRCASCTAYFFRSTSLIRMITISKAYELTLLRMLQPLTDRLKHSSFIAVTHP